VVILDAFDIETFYEEKSDCPVEDRTFLVAFPGFDVSQA
jgi:hypothetical protein